MREMEREFEHRLTEVEDRAKSNTKRLDEVETRQDNLDKLVGTVGILADREKRVEDDVKEIKTDVKSLTSRSGKRWDNLVNQIITILVATIAGFILAKIGF
jgi:predicted  nucleic acid-binding Zn-ribbon protein